MGDQDSGRALLLDALAQQREHLRGAFGIEIAGGLVRENERGPMDQRPCDRDALHFAPGEFPRHAGCVTGEADFRKHAGDADLHLRIWNTIQSKRQRDVLRHAQIRQNVKCLEHEPHVLPSQHRQRIVVERAQIGAIQAYMAKLTKARQLAPMALIGWAWPTFDAGGLLSLIKEGSPYSYYKSPEFNRLLNAANATMEVQKRRDLLHQAARVLHDDPPGAFLYREPNIYGLGERLVWKPTPDQTIQRKYAAAPPMTVNPARK